MKVNGKMVENKALLTKPIQMVVSTKVNGKMVKKTATFTRQTLMAASTKVILKMISNMAMELILVQVEMKKMLNIKMVRLWTMNRRYFEYILNSNKAS